MNKRYRLVLQIDRVDEWGETDQDGVEVLYESTPLPERNAWKLGDRIREFARAISPDWRLDGMCRSCYVAALDGGDAS